MRPRHAQFLAFALGLAAPLASYGIRAFSEDLGLGFVAGTTEVSVALLVVAPVLTVAVHRSTLPLRRAALSAAVGFVTGAVAAYFWWLVLYGDWSWGISMVVLAIEAAVLAFVALTSSMFTHVLLTWRGDAGKPGAV